MGGTRVKVPEGGRFQQRGQPGLDVIFCAGETLDQSEADQFLAIARAWINERQSEGEPA
jgi:triosephosphate isomerase